MLTATSLVAALATLAVASPPTHAAPWHPKQHAANLAYAEWGDELHAACPSGLAVRRAEPTRFGLGAEVAGWAWPASAGVYRCTVFINATRADLYDFAPMCSVVLHEAGHVIGYGHSDAHNGLMLAQDVIIKTVGYVRGHRVVSWGGAISRRCVVEGRRHARVLARQRAHTRRGHDVIGGGFA